MSKTAKKMFSISLMVPLQWRRFGFTVTDSERTRQRLKTFDVGPLRFGAVYELPWPDEPDPVAELRNFLGR